MLAYAHVVFDLDGTLVDSHADLAVAVNHALSALGLPQIEPSTVASYVGEGARVLVERALGAEHRDRFREGFELFLAHYGSHLLEWTRPYPGIIDALAGLRERGVALSVLTNKPVAMSRDILVGLDLAPYFVEVVGGDSLPVRKPDPAGLEHLRTLTGTPRERVLLVGDSTIDLRTARAGQIAFCGAGWGFSPDVLRATDPDAMIDHPQELRDIVERRESAAHRRSARTSS